MHVTLFRFLSAKKIENLALSSFCSTNVSLHVGVSHLMKRKYSEVCECNHIEMYRGYNYLFKTRHINGNVSLYLIFDAVVPGG